MIKKMLVTTLFSLVVACSNPLTVNAKPSAPVKIEYSVPKNIEVGTEITSIIRFSAKTDLQLLEIKVMSYSGLELVSGGNGVEFANIQSGDVRKIEVKIRLTDEAGYLSVFAATIDSRGKTQYKSIAIRYGKIGEATIQKMRPQGIVENSLGEKLILMPGESRK